MPAGIEVAALSAIALVAIIASVWNPWLWLVVALAIWGLIQILHR